jgi:hypothetical protein
MSTIEQGTTKLKNVRLKNYGDIDQAEQDAIVIREIRSRQGDKFLMDLIAEGCGDVAIKYNLNGEERARLITKTTEYLHDQLCERL